MALGALGLSGCSVTKKPIEPRAFNSHYSHAYNIANQTYLTRDYSYAGNTILSPLKDFSEKDIKDIESRFNENKGGNISIAMGFARILTGNLTGALDVVGGSAANISESRHPSSTSRWIVIMPSKDAANGIDAKNTAVKLIRNTALKILEQHGNTLTKVTLKKEGKATFGAKIYSRDAYTINGSNMLFGMYQDHYLDTKNGMTLGKSNLLPLTNEDYVSTSTTNFNGSGVFNFAIFVKGYVKGYNGVKGYERFIEDVTSKLPEGYYYYSAPFPRGDIATLEKGTDWTCKKCIKSQRYVLESEIVPAIYTQGKKYEFIKPTPSTEKKLAVNTQN